MSIKASPTAQYSQFIFLSFHSLLSPSLSTSLVGSLWQKTAYETQFHSVKKMKGEFLWGAQNFKRQSKGKAVPVHTTNAQEELLQRHSIASALDGG